MNATELYNLALEGRMYHTIAEWLAVIATLGILCLAWAFIGTAENCALWRRPMSPHAVKVFWLTGAMILICIIGAIYCGAMSASRPSIDEINVMVEKSTNANSNKH